MTKKTKAKSTNKKLTQAQREEVVRLSVEDGLTYTKIAEKMGCSIPNVSYLMKKHRNKAQDNKKKEEARTKASKETHGSTAEQLKIEIVDAIQSLPPLLKKQVMDELLTDTSNIVRLATK